MPVWVERNPGSPKGRVQAIRLEMSADDGATWHDVAVARAGRGWSALVAGSTRGLLLITNDTVDFDTPARRAISRMR